MNVLRRVAAWGALSVGLLAGAGCTAEGYIQLMNNADDDVMVQFGSEEIGEISLDGGAGIYTNDCYDGPIRVTYADGRTIKLESSICPGQELVISEETAELVGSASTN